MFYCRVERDVELSKKDLLKKVAIEGECQNFDR